MKQIGRTQAGYQFIADRERVYLTPFFSKITCYEAAISSFVRNEGALELLSGSESWYIECLK